MLEKIVQSAPTFRFTTRHLFYAMAVLGASIGLFGAFGFLIGGVIAFAWWKAFEDVNKHAALREVGPQVAFRTSDDADGESTLTPRSGFTLVELLVVICIIGILAALLLPAVSYSRAPNFSRCYAIEMALRNYQDQYGKLPPPCLMDAEGTPIHSWRVLLLPFLSGQQIYADYRFDEPWNSPHNLQLTQATPHVYRLLGSESGYTSIQAVVGPGTAWDSGTLRSRNSRDGKQDSLLFVECELRQVPWTSPRDLSPEEAAEYLTSPPEFGSGDWNEYFLAASFEGRMVTTSEGGVHRISTPSENAIMYWARTTDGERRADEIKWLDTTWRKFLWGNWVRLIVFTFVAILPIAWIPRWYWSVKQPAERRI